MYVCGESRCRVFGGMLRGHCPENPGLAEVTPETGQFLLSDKLHFCAIILLFDYVIHVQLLPQ